jgi:nucleotide-binding universal stress UspA family protein
VYERILVPLDGSDHAAAALAWAARLPCASVRLLHVRAATDGTLRPDLAAAVAALAAAGRAAVSTEVEGEPAEAIVRAAAEADLVVMGTRARGAGGRLIYGSVADRVARHSPTPTLLVRRGGAAAAPGAGSRVVTPLDGSAPAARAVPEALAAARSLGIGVHLVSVVEPPAPDLGGPDEAARSHREAHLAAVRAGADRAVPVSFEVRRGDAVAEILAVVRPGDLVAMTSHGGGGAQRWSVGAVAEAVLRRAPVPVLLVRTDGAAQAAG